MYGSKQWALAHNNAQPVVAFVDKTEDLIVVFCFARRAPHGPRENNENVLVEAEKESLNANDSLKRPLARSALIPRVALSEWYITTSKPAPPSIESLPP